MNPDRGMQAIIGVFLAFSLLWTLAILVPDDIRSEAANSEPVYSAPPKQFGLMVNGTHYVLDAHIRYRAQADQGGHVIYSATPGTTQRKLEVSLSKNMPRSTPQSLPSSGTVSETTASQGSSPPSRRSASLFPGWFWYGVVLAVYQARRFARKRRVTYDEGWFVRTGLDDRLMYGGDCEYEEDFLSVDGSFYGAVSNWSGEELDKFDVDV